jgi:hypothetical protein
MPWFLPIFFNAFFLSNNEVVVHLSDLWHAVLHVLRGPRPQEIFASANANFNLFIISIAVLENVPPYAGLQKKIQLFHTNRRSGRDRGSNPGHLLGRQRRYPLSNPLRLGFYPFLSFKFGEIHVRLTEDTGMKQGHAIYLAQKWAECARPLMDARKGRNSKISILGAFESYTKTQRSGLFHY